MISAIYVPEHSTIYQSYTHRSELELNLHHTLASCGFGQRVCSTAAIGTYDEDCLAGSRFEPVTDALWVYQH